MQRSGILTGRLAMVPLAVAIVFVCAKAGAIEDYALAQLQQAYLHARAIDEPTRRFVELFLRLAGVVWIVVEWVAAVYLIRGFYLLRAWLRETGP